MQVLVTGGAGFIGSAVVRQLIAETDATVINVDKLTYAGNLESLGEARNHRRYIFEQVDICDSEKMGEVFSKHRPSAVMHLAAESHVDRSIVGPSEFIRTNISGTASVLEVARHYWTHLPPQDREEFRFHHVSTDEVFGDLAPEDPPFTESSPYMPNSPYAASKATDRKSVV